MSILEYHGYVIYTDEHHRRGLSTHVYKGTEKQFKSGDIPPQWLADVGTKAAARTYIDNLLFQQPALPPTEPEKLMVYPKQTPYEARLLTEHNLEEIARWTNGSVKGIKLPPSEQVVCWYDQHFDGGHEFRVPVGMWIVKYGTQGFTYMTEQQLLKNYTIHPPHKNSDDSDDFDKGIGRWLSNRD